MFSTKKPIILILSLLLFSCGETIETNRDTVEIDSRILSQTDSLLNIVDEEFQHIIHDREIKEEEFHRLEDKVQEYQNVIVLDKEQQNDLTQRIEELVKVCEEKDSILNTLLDESLINNIIIDSLKQELTIEKNSIEELQKLYDSLLKDYKNMVSLKDEKINYLELFIKDNIRKSKIDKTDIFSEE